MDGGIAVGGVGREYLEVELAGCLVIAGAEQVVPVVVQHVGGRR
ncbi:MAG: hypothetical protein WDO73_36865 [Ignavibacteriota bacterium]